MSRGCTAASGRHRLDMIGVVWGWGVWKTFLWEKVGESGVNSYFYIIFIAGSVFMGHLIGEFDCKLDTKGRMVLPAALKRQMPDAERDGLVVNRGFEKHLVIYSRNELDKITAKLAKLNTSGGSNREFIRDATRVAMGLALDWAGRVLLPEALAEYGPIETDIVVSWHFNKIEVWSKNGHDKL